jgi:hypothetical protein
MMQNPVPDDEVIFFTLQIPGWFTQISDHEGKFLLFEGRIRLIDESPGKIDSGYAGTS